MAEQNSPEENNQKPKQGRNWVAPLVVAVSLALFFWGYISSLPSSPSVSPNPSDNFQPGEGGGPGPSDTLTPSVNPTLTDTPTPTPTGLNNLPNTGGVTT